MRTNSYEYLTDALGALIDACEFTAAIRYNGEAWELCEAPNLHADPVEWLGHDAVGLDIIEGAAEYHTRVMHPSESIEAEHMFYHFPVLDDFVAGPVEGDMFAIECCIVDDYSEYNAEDYDEDDDRCIGWIYGAEWRFGD